MRVRVAVSGGGQVRVLRGGLVGLFINAVSDGGQVRVVAVGISVEKVAGVGVSVAIAEIQVAVAVVVAVPD